MKPYEEDAGMDSLFKSSPAEIIIGSKEAKRSTKTFITSERQAIVLELIENHARNLIRTVARLHYEEHGVKLLPEEIVKIYPGCRTWVELHQGLIEHYASLEGFSVQAIVSMEKSRWAAQQRAESSIPDKPGEAP